MKFCRICGAQIQDGAAFCSKCGAKSPSVDTAAQQKYSSGYENYKTVPIYEESPQTPPPSDYVNPPTYQPPTSVPPHGRKKLSNGAIVGIVIGAVVPVLVVVGTILGVALSSSDSAQDFDNSYSQGDYSDDDYSDDYSDDFQPDDTDTEEVFDFSAGEIIDNTYTNSSLDIKFTASPDGLDSDKPTLDLISSHTSKTLYESSNGDLDETSTYDEKRGMLHYQNDSMQCWLDAELSTPLPDDSYDNFTDVYVVKYNESFDNIADYNKAFMLEFQNGEGLIDSNLNAGTVKIGKNEYHCSTFEFDFNPYIMIASTYKCGYYISIVIDPGSGDPDCAKDILACFS